MARRVLMKAIGVLLVLVTLSLTIQIRITAATRYSKVCSPACHLEVKATRKALDMETTDPGDVAVVDDYDFSRHNGDVPSPGVGH
ncbi:hypothetical protein RGQ29_029384 [Quercus rubra]|uniref:Uncharacterized protein n=1 Tax=Quercus rubra TaxID=3512 RepID=A0AAN7IN68_QUERU|nr:hypothetical protein RGQ29_029384 [Quercus rubra]